MTARRAGKTSLAPKAWRLVALSEKWRRWRHGLTSGGRIGWNVAQRQRWRFANGVAKRNGEGEMAAAAARLSVRKMASMKENEA
jgi:hypothetical protein